MMKQLLVDAPNGEQWLLTVDDTGGYFDPQRVLWDTSINGELPNITVGGMVRNGDSLVYSQAREDQHSAAVAARQALE